MLANIKSGEVNELAVVIKTDVHGSFEAIKVALEKLGDDKLKVKILLGAVGPINESDISLATASSALVFGFNVRAIPQARELAKRDNTEIRYHSIIYELIEDVKNVLSGMLDRLTTEQIAARRIRNAHPIIMDVDQKLLLDCSERYGLTSGK